MIACKAGERIDYRVTWLEMTRRPDYDWPSQPMGHDSALIRAENPPWWWFRALYDAVGRDYAWTDKHAMEPAALQDWLRHPDMALYTLMGHGWPQGFFLLDWTEAGVCDLAYFGLVPEAVGQGLGKWLLKTAVLTGWSRPGTERLSVNTCTLDHPRALIQYQRMGFSPVRTAVNSRVLTRDAVFHQPLL